MDSEQLTEQTFKVDLGSGYGTFYSYHGESKEEFRTRVQQMAFFHRKEDIIVTKNNK